MVTGKLLAQSVQPIQADVAPRSYVVVPDRDRHRLPNRVRHDENLSASGRWAQYSTNPH